MIFHFILPFILCGFIIIHFYYLHYLSSNNSLGYNINNKILFFPFIFIKDIFGLFIVITLYIIQLFFGVYSLSHPDNAFQVNELVTPLHIVPEWYFLSYYTMLKVIPNKNAGFIILLTSILILLLFGESRRLNFNSNFYNIHFFLIIICFLCPEDSISSLTFYVFNSTAHTMQRLHNVRKYSYYFLTDVA